MNWILRAGDDINPMICGGKASALAALAALAQQGINIPPWVVLVPAAMADSLESSGTDHASRPDEALLPSPAVHQQLYLAFDEIADATQQIAVRSSAIDEDGQSHSFAGVLESFLFVDRESVHLRVADVWRSSYSDQIYAYRTAHGLHHHAGAPAVLLQRMIDAEFSGVAFSADPVTADDKIAVINAVRGTAEKLVSGEHMGEFLRIDDRDRIIQHELVENTPIIHPKMARDIAALARKCAAHFGAPQDIEWAYAKNTLYLLQSRPITTLNAGQGDSERLWDNSNIVESFGGITSPLSYSFARSAYEAVYTAFLQMFKVPATRINAGKSALANMLGYIDGRIYYNLYNWYWALSQLPGFAVNRRFMEQMMGVRAGIPASMAAQLDSAGRLHRMRDAFALLRTTASLVWQYFRLPVKTRRFYQRLDHHLNNNESLENMSLDALGRHYRDLESALLHKWDAPLINDFFAMIYYGLLRALSGRWLAAGAHNALLQHQGGLVSVEPARMIAKMAQFASDNRQLLQTLDKASAATAHSASRVDLEKWPQFSNALKHYQSRFGERCLDELKLESKSTVDDPRILYANIVTLAKNRNRTRHTDDTKHSTNAKYLQPLSKNPIKAFVFRHVLNNARRLVRERENLRFERTRVFGRVRHIMRAIGRHLEEAGILPNSDDIYYLEINEVLGFIEGTTTCTDLATLSSVRRTTLERLDRKTPPPERFTTHGAVHLSKRADATQSFNEGISSNQMLQGTGACPGIVEGIARCIHDPRTQRLAPGEILVAERTDPAWIMLFSNAAALLVERGSLLSHSAIVSREMSLPSIVALPGLMQWIRDGERIRINGATGIIERLDTPQHKEAADMHGEQAA